MILAITMCMSIGFYNLAILIPFSHDLYRLVPKPPDPHSTNAQRFVFKVVLEDVSQNLFHE